MPNFRSESMEKSRGVLECYRKVCKRKLGQYNLQGIKCNCGKTIRPGYQITKNKVKLVGTQSNINLSSAGNSMTNLHSTNSELGKYSMSNIASNLAAVQPYASAAAAANPAQNINMAQIARDSIGFKSHEVRQKNSIVKNGASGNNKRH